MSDPEIDELAESARNRGLKLVRSRVRTPGKRRFGRVGLTDARGQPVFGMDEKGPIGKPEDVEDYLRNLGAKDWGASLDVAVLPRKNKPRRVAANARAAGVDCELEVWNKMPHVWPLFTPFIPEANRALDRGAAFIRRTTSRAAHAAQASSATSIV